MFSRFLLGKVPLQMTGFSPLFLHGTLQIRMPHPQYPTIIICAESFPLSRVKSSKHRTEFLQIEDVDNVTPLQMVRRSGACQKSNIYPLLFGRIMALIVWHLSQVSDSQPLPASWWQVHHMAVLELGLNWISRVSTYHGPHNGCQFLSWVVPSPLLGGGSSTGPTAL